MLSLPRVLFSGTWVHRGERNQFHCRAREWQSGKASQRRETACLHSDLTARVPKATKAAYLYRVCAHFLPCTCTSSLVPDTYHVIEVPKKKVLGKKKKKKRASLTWHSLWRASAFVSHPLASSPESWPHPAALRAALPHLFTASEGPWQASASAAPGRGE